MNFRSSERPGPATSTAVLAARASLLSVIVCRPSKGSSLDFEEIGSVARDAALLKVALLEGIVAVLVCSNADSP
jgi:hypothetical protein